MAAFGAAAFAVSALVAGKAVLELFGAALAGAEAALARVGAAVAALVAEAVFLIMRLSIA